MRRRLAEAHPNAADCDAKIVAGRLQDIALFAQMIGLHAGSAANGIAAQLQAGVADGTLDAGDMDAILRAAGLFDDTQTALRFLTEDAVALTDLGEGARRLILRETGFTTLDEFVSALTFSAERADQIITRGVQSR